MGCPVVLFTGFPSEGETEVEVHDHDVFFSQYQNSRFEVNDRITFEKSSFAVNNIIAFLQSIKDY